VRTIGAHAALELGLQRLALQAAGDGIEVLFADFGGAFNEQRCSSRSCLTDFEDCFSLTSLPMDALESPN